MIAFLSNNPSSNPAKENSFYSGKIVWKNEKYKKSPKISNTIKKLLSIQLNPAAYLLQNLIL